VKEKDWNHINKSKNNNIKEEVMDTYSIPTYRIRSPVTRDYYLRRLKSFFNYIEFWLGKILMKDVITLEKRQKKITNGYLTIL